MAALIREHTSSKDKLVVHTRDPAPGGEVLCRSGRRGLSVMGRRAPEVPAMAGPPRRG